MDANWEVAAAADFNGDSHRDLLWYNQTSGKIVLWFMSSSVARITGQFTNPASIGNNDWSVLAVGDFGQGAGGPYDTQDVVWQNDTSKKVVVWVHGPGRQPYERDVRDARHAAADWRHGEPTLSGALGSRSLPAPPIAARALALAVALAVAVPPAAAQDVVGRLDRTVIDWWGEREGLPQSWVVSIAQTPDGYLYLSTLEGVVRFDGVRFLPVRRPDAGRPASNRMGAMVLRRDGSLWVASENAGIFRVEGTALVLEHAARSLRLPTALAEDAGGALWVVAEGGVHRISPQGSLEQLDVRERVPAGVGAIAVTRAGAVWVAAPEGLARRVEGRFEALPSERAPRGAPVALHVTRDDAVLVLTAEGLFRLEGERCLRLGAAPPFTPLPGASIFEDRDGALWVGAGRQGLARFHGGAWSLVPARRGLTGTHVRALLRDREGSLWIGTEGRGLARMRDTSFAVLGRAEGLRDPFVWAHLVDRAGTLWIGSQDGTLHSWAGDTLRVFGREDGLPGGGVRALAQRRDGTLLVGTLGYGVWARRGPRFEPLRGAEALRLAAVRTMREDPWDGALWIGTERGLFRLGEGRLARAGEGGLRKTVTSLLFDRQRRLWVGTTGEGLWWSADRGASFSRIDDADGLPDRSVRAIHEDAEGRLWVGTEGGGLAVVRDGRVAAAVSQREGLFDNTVSVILDDGLGWMWMSCNRGVFRARIADLVEVVEGRRERVASEVFDEADGLISRECNGSSEPAGLRHADGSLSFSTMGGVAFVDPARLRAPVPAPPVVVERLVHDGIDTPLGSRVRLPPGRGNLELQFTAPTFLGAERVRFRFRLAPFDDWSEPVARRSAYYTNVPPGAYTFEVVAAGRDETLERAAGRRRVGAAPAPLADLGLPRRPRRGGRRGRVRRLPTSRGTPRARSPHPGCAGGGAHGRPGRGQRGARASRRH